MKTYEVVGDILKAFSVKVTVPDDMDPSSEKFDEAVADALELRRYGRDEGLNIECIDRINE